MYRDYATIKQGCMGMPGCMGCSAKNVVPIQECPKTSVSEHESNIEEPLNPKPEWRLAELYTLPPNGEFPRRGPVGDPEVQGGFPKLGVLTIMENQMEKKMENEMETGIMKGFIGVRVS